LAGPYYPQGIPIWPEEQLAEIVTREGIEQVVFAYSDVSHQYVMHKASLCLALGADFRLMGPATTMLKAQKPVVSVTAVRTGSGKSQTTRRVIALLREMGMKVVVIRHPMPYGNLVRQAVQRFASYADLDKHDCTIEEREEYEPHIDRGTVVYAGVDYERILRQAEQEADILLWDGGNNDLPFYRPDLQITVADPLRAGHEMTYHPGEANLRFAQVIVINKMDSASPEGISVVRDNIAKVNPTALVVDAASPIFVEDPNVVRGRRVLVVEDGPTLTHGEMSFGAGVVAARKFGAIELVDPRPYVVGSIRGVYEKYGQITDVLPAMGYGDEQVRELEQSINNTPCDAVVIATPIDLRRLVRINKPAVRVRYELQEIGQPDLSGVMQEFVARHT